jgi:hypothetical protein
MNIQVSLRGGTRTEVRVIDCGNTAIKNLQSEIVYFPHLL